MIVIMAIGTRPECGVSHGHQLGEEKDEDGDQGYAFHPAILCDWTDETRVRESTVCRRQKLNIVSVLASPMYPDHCSRENELCWDATYMYKRRSNDDARTEILCYEEHPRGNPHTLVSHCIDRERSTCQIISGSARASRTGSYRKESQPISRRLSISEDPFSHHSHCRYYTLAYHLP